MKQREITPAVVPGLIWVTPCADGHTTAPSTDSGFATLDEVVAVMGEPKRRTAAYVLYDGVIFSRLQWAS